MAVSGDTAVLGAPSASNADDAFGGAAYVFLRSAGTWAQQAKLTAPGADTFADSVAVSGDTAVIGANRDDAPLLGAGSAYVFVRSGTTWAEQAKLTASDARRSDFFGSSVAVSGDTAVVGSLNSGAVYVFVPADTAASMGNVDQAAGQADPSLD